MKKLIIALTIGLVSFWGCDNNSTGSGNGDSDSALIGTWISELQGNIYYYTINADGTGTSGYMDDGVVHQMGYGTYSIDGNHILITDGDFEGRCTSNPGIYEYTINNNNLTLSLVSDACSGRERFLSGVTMTRQ